MTDRAGQPERHQNEFSYTPDRYKLEPWESAGGVPGLTLLCGDCGERTKEFWGDTGSIKLDEILEVIRGHEQGH